MADIPGRDRQDDVVSVSSVTLQPLMAALLESVTPADVVSAVVERGIAVLGARAGLVALVTRDGKELEIVRTSGYEPYLTEKWARFPVDGPYPLSDVVRSGGSVYVGDRSDWDAKYPALAGEREGSVQASVSLPLAARQNVFGAIHFSFGEARQFSQNDRVFLGDIARQCALALERALLLEEVEAARARQEFLSRASALLADSLEYESRLEALTRLCVPDLADWAGVDVVGEDGQIQRLAVAHSLPEREAVMREAQRRYPPDPRRGPNTFTVIQTGERLFYPVISEELIDRGAVDAEHARLLKSIGIRAVLALPLTARGRTLGVLSLGMAPAPASSGRTFSPDAVILAEELARRAAVAVDNARLFGAAEASQRRAETVLESIAEEFFALDARWRFTYVNARVQQVWRRTREELLGRVIWDIFPEAVGGIIYKAKQEAMRERRTAHFEAMSSVRKRWVEGTAYPAEDGGITVYLRDIHERKMADEVKRAADEALRASEARYRRLLDTALEGVLFLDTQAVITNVNRRLAAMLGYDSPGDLIGRPIFSLFFPEDQAAARRKWVARLGGLQEEYELRLQRRDGSECWCIAHVSVERDPETNDVLGTFTMLTDISERRKTLQALQGKSNEVAAILESITDAFFALDDAWRFTYVNNEAERILLRRREELVGRDLWEEFPAAVGSEFETQYRRAAEERITAAFQAYYPPPLDAWYDVHAYPSPSGAGLSVYFRNINEERRREAERERLLAEQARLLADLEKANARQQDSLQQSEERFRLLVEGVQDYAIFMLDPDGRIATWNVGAERFKGYKASEIIGQHFSRFYTEEDIAIRHPWKELEIAAREGRYEEEGWRIRKDGSRFYANVVITALRGDVGELHGFAKVTRDITERRIREQEHAAAQVLEQQRRFLKDVLVSVTQGKLVLCDQPRELPVPLNPLPSGEPILLSRQTLKKVRARVGEVAAHCRLPLSRTQDLITAASECAMNSVQHAGGGTVRVFGDPEDGVVQVWVEDIGKGIDLNNLPRATLEAGFSTGGVGIGHGFSLMIACCQRIYLLTGATGTTVVLEQTRVVPEPDWLQTIRGG